MILFSLNLLLFALHLSHLFCVHFFLFLPSLIFVKSYLFIHMAGTTLRCLSRLLPQVCALCLFLYPWVCTGLMNVMEFYSLYLFTLLGGFSGSSAVKEICPQYRSHWRLGFEPWVSEIPWRRTWQPHKYSCLENPMDRGARWATVHRVTKSWAWLKGLSRAHLYSKYKDIFL